MGIGPKQSRRLAGDLYEDECTALALAEERALTVAATSLSRASTCRSSFGCCRTCRTHYPRAHYPPNSFSCRQPCSTREHLQCRLHRATFTKQAH